MIGLCIWITKVLISITINGPSTSRFIGEPLTYKLLVLGIFFSPNITFWPITVMLDIYSLWMEYHTKYSAAEMLRTIVGF
jgi:hypothetical protein